MSGWKQARQTEQQGVELRAILARVLRRWRAKRVLLGAMLVALAGLASFAAAAVAMPSMGDGRAAAAVRILAFAVPLAAAIPWILRPALRRIPEERVALYLEEHEPTLGTAVLGALAGDAGSRGLAERAVRTALARLHEVEDGDRIDRAELRRFAVLVGLLAVTSLATMAFRPAFVDTGAARFFGRRAADAPGTEPSFDVDPGDATIPVHGDVSVRTRVANLAAPETVELLLFAAGDSVPQRIPMAKAADGSYGALVFDLTRDADYRIEADGFRSPTFRLTVADLPYAGRVDVELRFPAYTGLAPQVLKDVRDIAAPRGTRARFLVEPTAPTPGGRVLLDDGRALDLAPTADGSPHPDESGTERDAVTAPDLPGPLAGDVPLDRDGFYRIELIGPGGDAVRASPEYAIDVLDDGAPTVRIEEPGRDSDATAIEEVFIETSAEDDYGVARLELIVSVNGQPEDTLTLLSGGRARSEVSAGHTLFLEELDLQPGDVIAYHARAVDTDRVTGPKAAVSDLYFLRIRPFEKTFRQADGGAGEGGAAGAQLSGTQRQIIAATYNLLRDSTRYSPSEYAENLATIALSQQRLREQVGELVQQLQTRGIPTDSSLARVAELLPEAARAMEAALVEMRADRARPALPPEQRALVELQRAEAVFRDVQVAQGQGDGGAGGEPEDLADLFELELDKMQNQYESVRRAQREEADRELDETVERLRELARRQQREAERARRAAQASQQAATGGAGQRELAEEAEEEARRLERLARDREQPQLEQRARELREAAEQMRRAAAGADPAAASRALQGLERAQRALENDRADGVRRGIQRARERASTMAREQQDLGRAAGDATGAPPGPNGERAAERVRERKELQAEELRALREDIERLAREASADQRDAARALRDAAASVRERRTQDKIAYSRELVRPGGALDLSRRIEGMIGEDLRDLERRLGQAEGSLTDAGEDAADETLEGARDLARALDSMEERLRQQLDEERARRAGDRGERAGEAQEDDPPDGQRQGGQPGEGQAQGGRSGNGQPANGRPRSAVPGDGPPGAVPPGIARQLQREAAQRLPDAEALRRRLLEEGRTEDARTLEEVLGGLQALASGTPFRDVGHAARLQEEAAAGARRLESSLRRQILGERAARSVITGSGEVPEEYRELVEEYFRSLSGDRRK